MTSKNLKGPRPVRALFALGILSLAVYAVTVALLTPGSDKPNFVLLGVVLAGYVISLYGLSVFVRGEAEASREVTQLRKLVEGLPQGNEITQRNEDGVLVIRTRPGRVRSYGFTVARTEDLRPGEIVQLKHYSLLRRPFHMVETWTGPCRVSDDGQQLAEVEGKKGPERRGLFSVGRIPFASREEVVRIIAALDRGEAT